MFACHTPCLAGARQPYPAPGSPHQRSPRSAALWPARAQAMVAAWGHCGSPALLLGLALAPAQCLSAACSLLPEPGSPPSWGSEVRTFPCLSPLSQLRAQGRPEGVTVLFLYLPLCNKRPEPCSLLLSVSLPAGRSPQLPWVPVPRMPGCPAAEHIWDGGTRSVTAQAWGEHPRHLGLKPFLLATT